MLTSSYKSFHKNKFLCLFYLAHIHLLKRKIDVVNLMKFSSHILSFLSCFIGFVLMVIYAKVRKCVCGRNMFIAFLMFESGITNLLAFIASVFFLDMFDKVFWFREKEKEGKQGN